MGKLEGRGNRKGVSLKKDLIIITALALMEVSIAAGISLQIILR